MILINDESNLNKDLGTKENISIGNRSEDLVDVISNESILDDFESKGGILGSGNPIGGGEVVYDLYYNGSRVGEVIMTNGTQEGEEAGIITQMSLDKDWENVEHGYEAQCSECGEIYFSCDEQYRNEWPNSSDMAESEAAEKHNRICGLDNSVLGKALDRTAKHEGLGGSVVIGLENGQLDWETEEMWAKGLASLTNDFTTIILPDYEVIPKKYGKDFLYELEKNGDILGYTKEMFPVVIKGAIKNEKGAQVTTKHLNDKGLLENMIK